MGLGRLCGDLFSAGLGRWTLHALIPLQGVLLLLRSNRRAIRDYFERLPVVHAVSENWILPLAPSHLKTSALARAAETARVRKRASFSMMMAFVFAFVWKST